MADFKDKFSGKLFKAEKFSSLSASLAASSDNIIDGRLHEPISASDAIAILPFRIKQGSQAKYFPGLKEGTSDGRIETSSIIRDTVRGIVYVPIKKSNFQENLIGVNSHISSTFASGAYLQASASFADKFSGVGDDVLFTFGAEEFYSSPSASKSSFTVGQLTASFDILESGSNTASFSAVHSESLNRDFEFNFPVSNFITHWALRFDNTAKPSIFYSSSINPETLSFLARFEGQQSTQNQTGSFNLTDNQFLEPGSGSIIGHGVGHNINGTNTNDGSFTQYQFKSRVAGDADSGSLYNISTQFPGLGQIIVYRHVIMDNFSSGSFSYHPTLRNASTGSTDYRTLYFYSGSGGSSEANSDFKFFVTSSTVTITYPNSTPLHTDSTFRHNADVGFYSPSGSCTSSILVQTASGVTSGLGSVFAQQYQA